MKRGLVLDKVVLLGRTLDEYRRFFALDINGLRAKTILDVASGISSFTAEAASLEIQAVACDPIYALSSDQIVARCVPDLDRVTDAVRDLPTYRWDFHKSPEHLRGFRERAYQTFLADYARAPSRRYVAANLPSLPFADNAFDLTLVSHLLFIYQERFDYEFHREALKELMRVTRGEVRIYPLVTFETQQSAHVVQMMSDPTLGCFRFEIVPVEFEFLRNANSCLRVSHR